jgi:hypothetical protein
LETGAFEHICREGKGESVKRFAAMAFNSFRNAMTRSKIRNCLTVVIVMFATLGPLLVAGQPSQSASLVPHSLRNTELTSGSQTWAVQHDGFAITGISCPSASTCYAVGNVSQGVAFTKMTGSIWSTPTLIAGVTTLSSLSCPTAQSCFAVGMSSSPSVPVVDEQRGRVGPIGHAKLNGDDERHLLLERHCVRGRRK